MPSLREGRRKESAKLPLTLAGGGGLLALQGQWSESVALLFPF